MTTPLIRDITVNIPETHIKEFEAILKAQQLVYKKSEDYNTGVKLKDYFPFGLTSYSHMIHTKSLRLVSLCKTSREANFESVEDTLMDLINYAAMALADIQEYK